MKNLLTTIGMEMPNDGGIFQDLRKRKKKKEKKTNGKFDKTCTLALKEYQRGELTAKELKEACVRDFGMNLPCDVARILYRKGLIKKEQKERACSLER